MTRLRIAALIASALAALAATSAGATVTLTSTSATFTTDAVGSGFQVNYDGRGGSPVATVSGLTAVAKFKLSSVTGSGKSWTFTYAIDNTSSGAVTQSRITGFGFNVNHGSNVLKVSGSSATGTFSRLGSGNVPNAQPNVDICFMAGGNNGCSGGGNGGLGIAGGVESGTITFAFTSAQSSLALTNFYDRYQSLNVTGKPGLGSASGLGTVSALYVPAVPEPQTWMTMVLGFGLTGAAFRRRRRNAVAA